MSPRARLLTGIAVAVLVIAAAAGYWWMSRPPAPYKRDNSGLYPINVSGKYGFMDRSGKTVIAPQFDETYGFSEGLAAVRIGTKWGYINTKGTVVITPQFEGAYSFRYGRATIAQGGIRSGFIDYGFIDKDGKYIHSPNFVWAGPFSGNFALAYISDGVLAIVNRSGKVVFSGNVDPGLTIGFTGGLAAVASNGKWGFIDTTGKWAINPQFEGAGGFEDGLAPVKVGGRWGYINQKGKFVVNPQYDSCEMFYDGYASFGSGGKFGFIDTKGRVVANATFLDLGHFNEGLAPVKTEGGLWGFLNREGKMFVSPQFDSADNFQNGLARVTALGKEAYITTTGAFVVDPFPGTTVGVERTRLGATPAAYFGVWNNVVRGGYVKVIVSGSSEKPRVHLWGSCSPQDCDCGEEGALWDGSALVTTFRQDNQATEFRLTLDRSGNLKLNCHLATGSDCVTMSYRRATPSWR